MGHSFVRTIVTALVAAALAIGATLLYSLLWAFLRTTWVLVVVGAIAFVLGIIAGVVGSYDLRTPSSWAMLFLDHVWALPSTLFGAVVGNLVYPFFGNPSSALSASKDWVAYAPRGSSGFGVDVLQTLGTVNIGGAGAHERVHLLQARILGPLYLPTVAASYVVTSLIQFLFTGTIGLLLWVLKIRQRPYFSAPSTSAVKGFWGWIYHSTPIELWAYATEP
jgi:hypothetical protein